MVDIIPSPHSRVVRMSLWTVHLNKIPSHDWLLHESRDLKPNSQDKLQRNVLNLVRTDVGGNLEGSSQKIAKVTCNWVKVSLQKFRKVMLSALQNCTQFLGWTKIFVRLWSCTSVVVSYFCNIVRIVMTKGYQVFRAGLIQTRQFVFQFHLSCPSRQKFPSLSHRVEREENLCIAE